MEKLFKIVKKQVLVRLVLALRNSTGSNTSNGQEKLPEGLQGWTSLDFERMIDGG